MVHIGAKRRAFREPPTYEIDHAKRRRVYNEVQHINIECEGVGNFDTLAQRQQRARHIRRRLTGYALDTLAAFQLHGKPCLAPSVATPCGHIAEACRESNHETRNTIFRPWSRASHECVIKLNV